MHFTIRPYQSTDKQELLNILQLNVPTYFAQEEVNDLAEYLDNHLDLYFVALDNNKIIGAAGINRNVEAESAALSWGFLSPNYHRKGAGSLLLKHRLNILSQDTRIKTIQVRTSQVVYKFFEQHNFRLIEVQKDYWAPGLDMYIMRYNVQ
ncbi:GNAT family N-acetyltransferase [Myroides sp. M-43]|uniref:GNAT family N-acetyltransferase n=1 Tax=Myroides oncorhynchi TaxID=2893756 RepID=UPI001E561BF5|nr:GNAT family N-acetyltransferase [Myroides oncorhynchi]MCC9044366.1 GNAT family N-acetyltransferase [Myroides oncorhynchi]